MNVDIAERLAKRRREAGYSQESLAEKLGVSRQAVSKWERSESSPDTDNLIALAQLYGVSLDDLLYVDESFKDDVVFEAADRAAERKAQAPSDAAGSAADAEAADDAPADTPADTPPGPGVEAEAGPAADAGFEEGEPGAKKKKVNIGFGGIHVKDGEDYVHVSWKDGVHVKDSGDGDEVHVGWDGVHVKEGKGKGSSSWVSAGDDEGNTVDWSGEEVIINGKAYENWQDAHDAFNPKSYVGKAWLRFPFPLVAIIAYLLLGFMANEWGTGLFVFFTIPVYYMVGHAINSKRVAPLLEGLYPLACVAWFLWMAFVLNQPHPAWVIFLTIPVVEWIIHSIARASRRRKRGAEVIDVEPDPQ